MMALRRLVLRKELVAGPLCPSKTPKTDQECVERWQKVEAMWSSEGELLVGNQLDDIWLVVVGNSADQGTTTESKRVTSDCVAGVKDAACLVSVRCTTLLSTRRRFGAGVLSKGLYGLLEFLKFLAKWFEVLAGFLDGGESMVASTARCIWEVADVLAEFVEALTNPVEMSHHCSARDVTLRDQNLSKCWPTHTGPTGVQAVFRHSDTFCHKNFDTIRY